MTTHQRGFTMIELLIYLGLFGILITGIVTGAFSVIESSGRNQTHAMLQEEGNFIIGKINYALSGAKQITSPATTDSNLVVVKYGSAIPVSIAENGTNVEYQDSDNPTPTILNNTNVMLSGLTFTHTAATGDGIDPESISATFTLSTHSPDGKVIAQDFSTTVYLRR